MDGNLTTFSREIRSSCGDLEQYSEYARFLIMTLVTSKSILTLAAGTHDDPLLVVWG